MKCILIVDPDPSIRNNFVELLRDQGNFIRLLSASKAGEAQKIIAKFKIDIVVTSVRSKSQKGLQFIELLKAEHPKIDVVAITETAAPKIVAKLEKLGVKRPLVEPVDGKIVRARLLEELDVTYGGQVRGITLSSFLQMLELEGKTCSLLINAGKKKGKIFFDNGELIAAETADLKGKQAALELLAWEDIQIDIIYSLFQKEKEIKTQLMGLLLESQTRQDEISRHPSDKRKHPRVGCLIAVNYDIDDWSYQSFIRNLSLGGAYIETEQPVTVGQKVSLALTLQNPNRSCRIIGTVVRRDDRGASVQFGPLSMRQRNILESIILPKQEKRGI
jgi:CheY-like chemotaxis protein